MKLLKTNEDLHVKKMVDGKIYGLNRPKIIPAGSFLQMNMYFPF